jgi:hypothetical protein
MDQNIGEIIKQIRESVDSIFNLPEKIINSVMGAHSKYLDWKARIAVQKELAALCEIGKVLQSLCFSKLDIIAFARKYDLGTYAPGQEDDVVVLKELFQDVVESLNHLRQIMFETSFSNTQPATEAAVAIAQASAAYSQCAALSIDQLRATGKLADICDGIVRMQAAGDAFIKRLDEQRNILGHTS